MNKNEYIAGLHECPIDDELCPYYDWRYQKCSLYVKEKLYPWEECEDYIEAMEINNFSIKALDKLSKV